MWNEPTKELLDRIPRLYETEHVPLKEKIVYLHFFIGGADFYITEFDGVDLFFGYTDLNDPVNAEWGYISFQELKDINIHGFQIDRDIYWEPKPAEQIKKIREGMRWDEEHEKRDITNTSKGGEQWIIQD